MGPGIYFIYSAALPGIYLSPCVYMSPALIWYNTQFSCHVLMKLLSLYCSISEIVCKRKCSRISQILVHSQIFSCIISFQKEAIHNWITKFTNIFLWTLWQSTYHKRFLSRTIPDMRCDTGEYSYISYAAMYIATCI